MTSSDHALIEGLLHEEEGPALDFKRDQYPFDGQDDQTKSELLKDILAFTNSWRRTTAYILVGVREVKGYRCDAIGVSKHLDDAHLQQFVSSKTNRPVIFQYRQIHFDGVEIGMLEIPEQERPIFLNRRFGNLAEDTVYIRRGSSTAVARPDEVSQMGTVPPGATSPERPDIVVEWANIATKEDLSTSHSVTSSILDPKLPDHTFGVPGQGLGFGVSALTFGGPRSLYSEEIIAYAAEISFTSPVGLKFTNQGSSAGKNVIFVGSITKHEGLEVRDDLYEPSAFHSITPPSPSAFQSRLPPDEAVVRLRNYSDRWELNVEIGDIRPGDEIWSDDFIFIGSSIPNTMVLEAEIRAENIPEPVVHRLEIHLEVEHREMRREDVEPYLDDEYRKLLERGEGSP